ncbi:uncharacterized protein GLRG_02842 [Colletotrichum graminicola M1.001]|uniref:Uncharacterized protein n=1 Tax=Colletotrichum graminicola (strain M1.001 / M2 / FGSC 10212) TaxID=645133 RepID=E3QA10_COLGM|nr:uncharacterized protein GLRG_02842 [Colletotrichum graminicola M1.001]EFQ27698.1 hypothetical protein GLRG_02842 [Colletotrichum graminicola M1.001]
MADMAIPTSFDILNSTGGVRAWRGGMMSELIYGDKRVCDISYSSSNPHPLGRTFSPDFLWNKHPSFLFLYCDTTKPHDYPSSASHHTSSIRCGHHSSASPTTRGMTKNMKPLRNMLSRPIITLTSPNELFPADYCTAYCPPVMREKSTRRGERSRTRTHLKWEEGYTMPKSAEDGTSWSLAAGEERKRGVGRHCVKDGVVCIAAKSSVG